ncbi:MAG: hypothetical protein SO144_02820 [Campylobacter sp.]|nr:hypothetical protein [Campylobacter sp.]
MLIFSRTIESGRQKISPLSPAQLITAYSHSSMIFKASFLLSSLSFLRIFILANSRIPSYHYNRKRKC